MSPSSNTHTQYDLLKTFKPNSNRVCPLIWQEMGKREWKHDFGSI